MEAYADVRTRPRGGWEQPLARAGLVAKGVSYAIVGVLALKLAFGDGGKATSRQGALEELAGTTFGTVLLILLAIGLACYAAWRFIQAWQGGKWTKRLGWAARGLVYSGLTYSAARILVGSGAQQSQNSKAHKTTAVVLAWPAGVWIVGIAGAVVVAIGLWQLYSGISRRFEEKWRGYSKWGSRAGVVGHIARFVVFGLIGWFVIKAAVEYDPKQAIGLDGALQKLAHASYGSYLLALTAAGLIAYAFYCVVDARYRDPSR
jgi:Domain of Unknown Function (DUF1206)